ncbi:adenine nucleotide alpha hydrolase [Acidisphaera sp. L21]|uniref:adenine nucleotide alpha hydrolase n=1 Tax=Acidisphaera sp. L21 TaxID=1641851 RepID=UPI00131B5007|nr:adenine nucleotide alpha hydrolase [Acidisphaera sp. L21]
MNPHDRLRAALKAGNRIAVAVSGGIDSLTLATASHRILPGRVTMHHATSPAVPAEATERTRALAQVEGWQLDVFDAGEFADPAYRANPVNRCFFCKTNLYGAVARRTSHQIVSGTNLDDLGDYRPGLEAARDHQVRHPFVEAEIDKRTVRALAAELGLGVLSELPSAPCLSSRVETGIRIEAAVLAMVHEAEKLVGARLSPKTVRCRVRGNAVVIELDEGALVRSQSMQAGLRAELQALAAMAGLLKPIDFAPYTTGSAFLRSPA